MVRERHALDSSLPHLSALGIDSIEALLTDELKLDPRQELVASELGYERYRFPLPGTPDETGRLTARPGPAGTGWVVLERWLRPALAELFRGRFTQPPSGSVAERRWNLLCHVRAHGVATARPLAVGALGAGLVSKRSFLVSSELEDYVPLAEWLASEPEGEGRTAGLRSLGAALTRLRTARIELPSLTPLDFSLSRVKPAGESCSSTAPPTPGGMKMNRLPSVVLSGRTVWGGARLRSGAGVDFTPLFANLLDEAERRLLHAPEPEHEPASNAVGAAGS